MKIPTATRVHLLGLAMTWALALLLLVCLDDLLRMALWFFLATCYIFLILAGLFDLHLIDKRAPHEDP